MSRANLGMFEADLSASLSNLQRILNFYPLRNLASNELFLLSYFVPNILSPQSPSPGYIYPFSFNPWSILAV